MVTFTAKKDQIKAILNDPNAGYNNMLGDNEKELLQEFVMDHHPEISFVTIDKLWLQPNGTFKHNNFYIDGTIDGRKVKGGLISVGKATANPTKTVNIAAKTNSGLRNAIYKDLLEIKKFLLESIDHCEICGAAFNKGRLDLIHTDHTGDNEFRHIVNLFYAKYPHIQLTIQGKDRPGGTYVLKDDDATRKWVKHHNANAQVQLTCSSCNLSKEKL